MKGVNIKRIFPIDLLKSIAIILVIIDHSYDYKNNALHIFIFKMAVPIFMIISGITLSKSCINKSVRETYIKYIKYFIRYSIPMFFTILLYLIFQICTSNYQGFSLYIKTILLGNYGLGAYYYALLVGLLLLFPFIYRIVSKNNGLVILFIINIAYDIFAHLTMSTPIYRILLFRYLMFIGFGIYLFNHEGRNIKLCWLVSMFCVGFVYLIIYKIYYNHGLFTHFYPWENTSVFSSFYVFPIFYLIYKHIKQTKMKRLNKTIEIISKSTYHIFYAQMIFFWVSTHHIYKIITIPIVIQILCNIIICVIGGIAWYYIENIVRNKSCIMEYDMPLIRYG